MKNNKKLDFRKKLSSNRFKYGSASIIISIIFIAIIIAVNIIVSVLTERFPSVNIDLTANKTNTLSDEALKAIKNVQNETEIMILVSEDNADYVLSMGDIQYSQVSNLAKKMRETNDKIKIKFLDLDSNPQLIQEYSDYSLSVGDIIVKTDKRSKHLVFDGELVTVLVNQNTYAYEYTSNIEGLLVNAVGVVNMEKVPTVAVAVGHNEMLPSSSITAFNENLRKNGIEIEEFNIMTDEIPSQADVVFIPTPSTDYTKAEIEKLKSFLSDDTAESSRTIFYTADYTQPDIPNLESFLEEWGIKVQKAAVAESDTNNVMPGADVLSIFVKSSSELFGANYDYLTAPYSSPLKLTFDVNQDIGTQALWTTADTAYIIENAESDKTKTEEQIVAAMSSKTTEKNGDYINSSVVVFGSSEAFLDYLISSNTFGNRRFFTDLFLEITGADSSQVYIEPLKANQYDMAVTRSLVNVLGIGVFTVAIPLVIVAVGLVIFKRRRHL